jgi:acyl carrier protein
MVETYAAEIKAFIITNFLFGQAPPSFSDEQSFLESGIIDSTGLLELVSFLEQKYGISIGDRELIPENLDSLRNASQLVARKVDALAASQP